MANRQVIQCLSLVGSATLVATVLAGDTTGAGILVLNSKADGALSMTGNSSINVPANAVYVNSASKKAITTVGAAVLDTPNLYVVGKAEFKGTSMCTGTVTQALVPFADPLSGLVLPSRSGAASHGTVSVGSTAATNLSPGLYTGLSITGNAKVTLAPGVYFFQGNVKITSGTITGAGVCLVMLTGSLEITGASSLSLSPAADGTLGQIVITQAKANTSAMKLAGGSEVNITGSIYAPAAEVWLTGNSTVKSEGPQMGDAVICDTLRLNGTSSVKVGRTAMPAMSLPSPPLFD